ncbi:hypothetical protein JXR01_00480 [Candidatus Kaiserbacteria bacterium]|nr:MAG: hypothetical protein JXR01_00480 [Candidatus Kaiserbacteria bacterium]
MYLTKILTVLFSTLLVLCVPLLAMQFTDHVVWGLADFIIAGVLLLIVGFSYQFLIRRKDASTIGRIIGISIVIVILLTWAELGVGLFGTPWAGS